MQAPQVGRCDLSPPGLESPTRLLRCGLEGLWTLTLPSLCHQEHLSRLLWPCGPVQSVHLRAKPDLAEGPEEPGSKFFHPKPVPVSLPGLASAGAWGWGFLFLPTLTPLHFVGARHPSLRAGLQALPKLPARADSSPGRGLCRRSAAALLFLALQPTPSLPAGGWLAV